MPQRIIDLELSKLRTTQIKTNKMSKSSNNTTLTLLLLLTIAAPQLISVCKANDITREVFGDIREGIVAAFGDFNSDELTDVFIIRNQMTTMQILYGESDNAPPLLKPGPFCNYNNFVVISIVPGDFDGDALMDVLVMLRPKNSNTDNYKVLVNWGGADGLLNCTSEDAPPMLITKGEPLAIDYNSDMIIDLYGLSKEEQRTYWIFQESREPPRAEKQPVQALPETLSISLPNANAYLDYNNDNIADLFIQNDKHYEIWLGSLVATADEAEQQQHFFYNRSINLNITGVEYKPGQAVFADFELKGVQNVIIPVCFQKDCSKSTILVLVGDNFRDLGVNFKDSLGTTWGFVPPVDGDVYLKTITARSGDYNMDGYPDLILTLQTIGKSPQRIQTFLLENVACSNCIHPLKRTFEVRWYALDPLGSGAVAGAFYDFYQDGVLDVILINKTSDGVYRPLAFRNTLDYDANFVKVIVLTGLVNKKNPPRTTIGHKKLTYGTNLPGPRISYATTTQDGDKQYGSSVQLPQSAYFALQLPYTIFGLGRTPNFVDTLTVALGGKYHQWTQLIPNSQIIVVPEPLSKPEFWKAQLFVTPSKLILMSVVALGGTCLVILLIILVLYIKEKREDKQEQQQEPHRFHFDAM